MVGTDVGIATAGIHLAQDLGLRLDGLAQLFRDLFQLCASVSLALQLLGRLVQVLAGLLFKRKQLEVHGQLGLVELA